MKLINYVTTSLRFFDPNVHCQKDFASKFCIHIIEYPRPFKQYSYFGYLDFFEFYQIHKTNYNLDVGIPFQDYLTKNDTEMFTTLEKFTDLNGKYKCVFDHAIYIFSSKNRSLGLYSKNLCRHLKKRHDKVIFDLLITTLAVQDRETTYNGMKSNVVHYGLKHKTYLNIWIMNS